MKSAFILFQRELLQHLRSGAPYVWRLIVLIALFIAVGETSRGQIGDGLFLFIAIFAINYVLIALAGLVLFATTITEERENKTLELLFLSELNSFGIILGKLASRGTGAMILLLIQLPIALLAVTLGGVSTSIVASTYGLLGLYLFFVANAGIAMSALCKRSRTAGLLTGVILFLHSFAGEIAGQLSRALTPGGLLHAAVESIAWYAGRITPWSGRSMGSDTISQPQLLFHLIAGGIFFLLACVFLARRARTSGAPKKSGAKKGRPRRHPWRLPFLWKDFVLVAGGRRTFVLKLCLYAALVCIFATFLAATSPWFSARNLGQTLIPVLMLCLVLEVSFFLSTSLHSEIRGNTLPSLATIPTNFHRMALEKVFGALLGAIPVTLTWGLAVLLSMEPWDLDFILREFWIFFFMFSVGTFYAHITVLLSLWIGRASPVAAFGTTVMMMFIMASSARGEEAFVVAAFVLLMLCVPLHIGTLNGLRAKAAR
ncbi:MAG: hypothetical protein AAF581_04885 [Planctomycetota bacterium]